MITISEKEDCCGCGACKEACPKNCITLEVDNEGFLYPQVDTSLCINCSKCTAVCPIIKQKKEDSPSEAPSPEAYVAYYDNPLRLSSSSGGIFSLVAEYILKKDGVVFGAAFDEQFQVHHICVESVDDLSRLRGSKYTQSRLENTYAEAKTALLSGRLVLFSGTACQIAGLKGFLGKDYENLLTLDVLCHGVPSPLVWKKYMEEFVKKYRSSIQSIFFRRKEPGWKTYSVEFKFNNSKIYKKLSRRDPFMLLFLNNLCLRPSCHKCAFKSIQRCSDITLGDAWGVEAYMPDMDDDKGTSIILLHSEKAKKVFAAIQPMLTYKQAECDKILPPTSDARKSVTAHPKRAQFFSYMQTGKSVFLQVKIHRFKRLPSLIWKKVFH